MPSTHSTKQVEGWSEEQWERALPFFQEAEALFERFGFKKTTIEDICRAVGASKRTFYELFDNKIDFALKLAFHVIQHMSESRAEEIEQTESAAEAFCLLVDAYFEIGREHPFFRVFLTDPDLLMALSSMKTQLMDVPFMVLLQQTLAKGLENGEFRSFDPEAVALIVAGMLDSLCYMLPEVMDMQGPLEKPEMELELRQFILAGMLKRSPEVETRINNLCRIGGPKLDGGD